MIVNMKLNKLFFGILLAVIEVGCGPSNVIHGETPITTQLSEADFMTGNFAADVLSVKAVGQSGHYQFEVEISSPDASCDQYADWWEVLNEDGKLVYRRVLLHSHVKEQPFIRSGGPVPITDETIVYVRAHMKTNGYGGRVLKGSVESGFQPFEVEHGFAADVEYLPPLPEDCAF